MREAYLKLIERIDSDNIYIDHKRSRFVIKGLGELRYVRKDETESFLELLLKETINNGK
jgi:hypothetical protein